MKKLIPVLCGLFCIKPCLGLSGQAYMERFNTYIVFSQHLPMPPANTSFLDFINGTAPLSVKLREQWLHQLAKNKDWSHFSQYYQSSTNISLQCDEQIANYNTGKHQEALKASIPLWLSGDSRPASCTHLFDTLLKDANFDQNLITERIKLALERRNIQLARYLLKQYKTPHPDELRNLNAVYQNPASIYQLNPGGLNSDFYLYGLKRMVTLNMNQALKLWQQSKTYKMLNQAQQQSFLAHIALYKAMRNHEDSLQWFAKVSPQFYNDVLLDWQIRFALKNKNWPEVNALINTSKNKEEPCWQYWLARSLEEQGTKNTSPNTL